MTQVGAPVQGEVLAGRYRLEEALYADAASGHALWRGTDNLLNRTVSIELRVPGGEAAEQMIAEAVAAGRIVHPSVIGVYDAVDEGPRAYVVREWVNGQTLYDTLANGPLHPARAASLVRNTADALAGIHATGHAHGNLTPSTVLIGNDDEVTLVDLHLGGPGQQPSDIRALGGLLYAGLTGQWPDALPPHRTGLPDATRVDGRMCSPRQIRAGIPGYLDALTMDLLDPAVPPPTAADLASELRRYDVADPALSALAVLAPEPATSGPRWTRVGVLVVGILVVLGVVISVAALGLPNFGGGGDGGPTAGPSSAAPAVQAGPVKIVRATLLDPPDGDFAEDKNVDNAIDGNASTVWKTDQYNGTQFAKLKPGLGLVLDLGGAQNVSSVTIGFDHPGATFEVRAGTEQPSSQPRDIDPYNVVGKSQTASNATTTVTFDKAVNTPFLVVWLTDTGTNSSGKYQVAISEISVKG
ncbi:protein kinase family protein [Cryptosporangium aurantiacum]|uniref:non-specific serine/threonine protein kinase n=1 Tax=Cryptosporangium aurantiacum TaxID=134849 RepID=A0A1M7RKL2_9ACTN|nr:protein kinase family protein [Cryptosporangium aurantiacum]SHN46847.1 Protein kinase domain-containing protein [Cryptosporangium aurantiacum]